MSRKAATRTNTGLTGFDWYRRRIACVIQRPQSGIQRQTTNATNVDIEYVILIETIDLDAEYEALCAEFSAALV